MDPPADDDEVKPENLEEAKERGPLFRCDLLDIEIVRKISEALLPGLASACVDNTMGGLFKTPGSVAVDIRREMVDYLFQRSENCVAESVVLEGGPDGEVFDHPFDIISDFIDDFAVSKRNIFSRVSGWLLSERREDRIDDFVQEMELNGFWLIGRREAVSQTLVKNVDIKNTFHCDRKFKSLEELEDHLSNCSFRMMNCMNEGCNSTISAAQFDYHDSICPFKILPCEQKCSDSIMRREMDRHCITVCPMKLTKCPFYQVGCQPIIPQSTINQHRSEHLHSHLLYILQPIHRKASVEDLKKRVDQLEKLSSHGRLVAARDARSLTFLVKDLEAKLGPLEISSKTKDDEAGEKLNDTKEENAGLSLKEEDSVKPQNEKEGGLESPTKHIQKLNDTKEETTGLSPKEEDSVKPRNEKKEGLESPNKHIQCADSSTEKCSISSAQAATGNSQDEKEESTESSPIKEKYPESPVERKILMEPSTTEEEEESTLEKKVHADSPAKGGEQIMNHFPSKKSVQNHPWRSILQKNVVL